MGKAYPPDVMAKRLFVQTSIGIIIWVAAACIFVILRQ